MPLSPSFPLSAHEWLRTSRRPDLYFYRFLVPALALVALALAPRYPRAVGGWTADVVAALQFAIVYVATPLLAAPPLQRERHDGSLGLLLLADFRGWDILFAKWASAFLTGAMLLVATFPLLVFGAYFGGISVTAVPAYLLHQIAWVAAVSALALLGAALTHTPARAVALAYALLVVVLAAQGVFVAAARAGGYVVTTGLFPDFAAGDIRRTFAACGPSTAVAAVLTFFALAAATWALHRTIGGDEFVPKPLAARPRIRRRSRRASLSPVSSAQEFLDRVGHGSSLAASLRVPAFLAAVVMLPLSALLCMGWMPAVCLACADGLLVLRYFRTVGAHEDLWLTPMTDVQFEEAYHLYLRAKLRGYLPAFALALFYPIWTGAVLILGGSGFESSPFLYALLFSGFLSAAQTVFLPAYVTAVGLHRESLRAQIAEGLGLLVGVHLLIVAALAYAVTSGLGSAWLSRGALVVLAALVGPAVYLAAGHELRFRISRTFRREGNAGEEST